MEKKRGALRFEEIDTPSIPQTPLCHPSPPPPAPSTPLLKDGCQPVAIRRRRGSSGEAASASSFSAKALLLDVPFASQ